MVQDALALSRRPRDVSAVGIRLRALIFATAVLTLMRAGAYWDVYWHYAVGRDSFFIPPHDLIYAGVAVSGLLGLFVVWRHGLPWRAAASPFPWGWLIQMCGAGLMVLAAPFDDLWHRRYGIDVTIWSPPHMLGVFGGWTMHAGLCVFWAIAWRTAGERPSLLPGLLWATTLLVSLFNFGLIPAMRWSVLQPVTPTLYSALGSLLLPGSLIALVWFTGRPWTVAPVFVGLVVLRLLDQPLWTFGLHYVVPLFGQSVRRADLTVLHRHFWLHPLLNAAVVLAVYGGSVIWRRRSAAYAALAGALSGLAIFAGDLLISTVRFVAVLPFRDRGRTGADFHAETDLLLRFLGTGAIHALGWAVLFGALSGLAGYTASWLLGRAVTPRAVRPLESSAIGI